MSARDELLKLHTPLTMDAQKQPEYRDNTESALHGYSEGVEHALDTVWAKGYRKPRTITTVEELDALEDGSIVMADWATHQRILGRWVTFGSPSTSQPELPATVLHEPEAEATR